MKTFFLLLFFLFHLKLMAKDYVVYSIAHDLPMGVPQEVLRKNYYINMGKLQGVEVGSVLNVIRTISVHNDYEEKERTSFQIKLGELKVIHSEDSSAIGIVSKLNDPKLTPILEVSQIMIGDFVTVKTDNN